ncbi:MAG: ParB/RepB/Spo0J family partition protein [Bacteroidia bacterium]
MKRNALGRGLGAILPIEGPIPTPQEIQKSHTVEEIPIEAIEANPFQPRLDFPQEELDQLAESIRQHGLIQPITVRKIAPGRYQLIAGERRLRAAKKAGLTVLPAYVREAENTEMLAFALIENIQRQDLNPIETALAYQRLAQECNLTLEKIADYVGKSRPTINNFIRLLRLPPEIQKALKEGKIDMGHARPLIPIDDPHVQLLLFRQIIEKGLSARQVEELVRKYTEKPSAPTLPPPSATELALKEIQKRLTLNLGAPVSIQMRKGGKGEIRIRFTSQEELDRLLELLGHS